MSAPMSLFDKYGGADAMQMMVEKFYVLVNNEPSLDRFFAHIDIEPLLAHQVRFFSQLFGGPVHYPMPILVKAHSQLRIDAPTFETFLRLFQETLVDCAIEPEDVAALVAVVAGMKNDFVTT
jgi:hemoglobin